MKPRIAIAVLPFLVLTGCGTLETHSVVTGAPSAAQTGPVDIVLEGSKEPEGLEEVAIVQAVGRGSKADLEDLIDGLKEEARLLGCDAVVRVHVDQGAAVASASGIAGRVRPASRGPAAGGPPIAPATDAR